MSEANVEETPESKLKRLKREERKAFAQFMVSILNLIAIIFIAIGFVFSIFHLMSAIGIAEVLKYGFSSMVFAILFPSITISNKHK